MAKVLQVVDVNSLGHMVRLSDGRTVLMPHGGQVPHIGEECEEYADESDGVDLMLIDDDPATAEPVEAPKKQKAPKKQ